MNVAVPLFGQDVSPRLGCIHRLLVATTIDGQIQHSQVMEIEDLTAQNLADWLVSMRISTLICGGISHCDRQTLESHGIDVIWGVIGPAEAALCALATGSLHSDQFVSATGSPPKARERPSSGRGRRPERGGDGTGACS